MAGYIARFTAYDDESFGIDPDVCVGPFESREAAHAYVAALTDNRFAFGWEWVQAYGPDDELPSLQFDYIVEWEIRADANGRTVVHNGQRKVTATDEDAATAEAIQWVHDNEPYADPRIDPIVEVREVYLEAEVI